MEAFLFGVAITSFVGMLLMASRGTPPAPPVVVAAQSEPPGDRSGLGVLFVIFLAIVFVVALIMNR